MSAQSLSVTCTECGSATAAQLPRQELDAVPDETKRLLGTHVTCENCGTEFDCYYY